MWVLFVNNYVVLFSFPYWFLLLYRVYNTIDLLQCDEGETFLLKTSTPAVPEEEEEVVTLDIKKIEKKQPLQSPPKPETKSVEEKNLLIECQNEYESTDISRLISLSKSIRVLGKKC